MMSDNNEDHPHIIKMPDVPPVPEYGLGYEIYKGMKRNPEKIAQYVVETGESQTFSDLLDLCIRVAVNLKKQNLSDDNIVGLCVDNHKYSCVPYIASLFLGYKVVALDPAVSAEDKSAMLLKVTPKIIFVDQEIFPNMVNSLNIANLNIKLIVIGKNIESPNSFEEFLAASEEDINSFQPVKLESNEKTAVIFFGSGTTGVTKGICISHLTILSRTMGPLSAVSVTFTQLNWISYAIILFISLRHGSPRVLMKKFDVKKIWTIIQKYNITFVFASVFQIAEIAESDVPKDADISALKVLGTGGSSLPSAIFEKLSTRFPGIITIQGYGLTEMGGVVLTYNIMRGEHHFQRSKPNSCGKPIEGIWYKVVDVDTEKILGPGEQGELRLKSKLAMTGYHNIDSSEAYDSAGWLKTGDIVYYDEDHCFFVVDRLKEMIKYRSWTISPSTLEHILMAHPAVDKAAVIGIHHGAESDYPMGIVTLKYNQKATPKELEDYVNEKVIDRQRLRDGVKIISEMPLTSTGKIQKRILRKMVMDGEL